MNATRLAAAATAALGLGVAVGAAGATTAAGPVNSSPPSVSGTVQQGQRLTASTGSWSGGGTIDYSFQWQRCSSGGTSCGSISGATSQSYDVGSSDVGKTLRVVVTATSSSGSASAASSPTGVVAPAGSAPRATKQPDPHGTAQVGNSVSVDNGAWSGTSPITYSYQWQRCSANGSCANVSGATKSSYDPVSGDVGYRLRAIVTAKNGLGSSSIGSNLTAAVLAAPAAPANTSRPTVSAPSANVGGTVTGSVGAWSSAQSISYGFGWYRCDASANHCQTIAGATGQTYMLTAADAGSTVEFVVKATNATGSNVAVSAPTPIVTNDPPGTIHLPNGRLSIPASSVVSPDRLVVAAVGFSSYPLRSRRAFTCRLRIVDARGYLVRSAIVDVTGIPYGWVRAAPEVASGENGVAAVTLRPTSRLPLRKGGQLVLFVRARRPGTSTMAAESAHRLVQLALAPPRRR